jgi:hypothetical protein
MNQTVAINGSATGDLSLNELDSLSGGAGNTGSFGPFEVSWWKDGAVYVGVKGFGGVLVDGGGVQGCDAKGQCHPL